MKVLTTKQIREADAYTIENEPVASIDLMERAAAQLHKTLLDRYAGQEVFRIFCGHGNNGGDGIALARLLAESKRTVCIHIYHGNGGLSPDGEINRSRLPKTPLLTVTQLVQDADLPEIDPEDVVVDALLGSGLTREPDGFYATLIDHINQAEAEVVAVDIPSGLFGEDNRTNSMKHVIRASLTLTFQIPKLSLLLAENGEYVGDWISLPIGLLDTFFEQVESPWYLMDHRLIRSLLKPRRKFDHKGTWGHALLISGSVGKAGAAVLGAHAALHAGTGLVTVHTPGSGRVIIQTAVPEAMVSVDPDTDYWTSLPDLTPYTAIGMGPGVGTHPETRDILMQMLERQEQPVVLDADALNLIAQVPGGINKIPKNSILTPHPGEFKRLFGEDPDELSRLDRMRRLAQTYELILVLKGAHTVIAATDGQLWFNDTGNPGMATAGSGDVLTGIITGLLAQGYDPLNAARIGVYLHGVAGDFAAEVVGMEALTAGDLHKYLFFAFQTIR